MSITKIEFPYYQVQEGENLKSIAKKFGVDSTKILLDNCLAPKQIKPGVFLTINKE